MRAQSHPAPYTPRKYQEKAIKFFIERPCGGLFLRPGRGKTGIVMAGTLILKSKKYVKATLVICPLRPAYLVWPKEGRKWKEFNKLSIGVLHGKDKDKVLDEKHDIYVVNFDGLPWLMSRLSEMKAFPFDQLIVDESSKLRDMRTKRYQYVESMTPLFKRRWILTGSPRPKALLDLFGPVYIMDRGATFGRRYTAFRERYFFPTGYGGYDWVLKPKAEKKIFDELAPRVLVLAEKDSDVGLPPVEFRDIEVELPPKAQAIYDQLETTFMVRFKEGRLSAANAAVLSMKVRQAASGAVYLDDKTVKQLHEAKLEALDDLIEEQEGQPLIVMYQFEHEVDLIRKFLKRPDLPRLGGGASAKKSIEIEDAWNAGKLDLLLAHEQSMGHGLNLQEVEASMVWFSLTWSYENYDQTYQRIWRSGQKGKVVVHHILALNTLDTVLRKNVNFQEGEQNRLMDYLADYWKDREVA